MKPLYIICTFFLITILFFNCQKEISAGNSGTLVNPITNPIVVTLQGNILDETGQPATGVLIKAGDKTAFTDLHGYFRIHEALPDKNASLVTAEKQGYFKSYRTFRATSGANQVVIKLTKKTVVGTINGNAGGDVTLSNGAKISLPVNSSVTTTGSSYTGAINVYAAYIDPASPDINQVVPGSFMANDKDKKVAI